MGDRPRHRRVVFGVAALSLALAAGLSNGVVGVPAADLQPAPVVTTRIEPPVKTSSNDEAFDWLDAAIGGATVLGLVLVAAGASSAASRRSEQPVLADMQPMRKEHEQ